MYHPKQHPLLQFRVLFLLPILLFFLFSNETAAKNQPTPNDFAYGAELSLMSDSGLHEVKLTEKVYSRMTRSDLGDVRIFNKDRESVSYLLMKAYQTNEVKHKKEVNLTFFPIFTEKGVHLQDTDVIFNYDENGRITHIASKKRNESRQVLKAYIIDCPDKLRVNEYLQKLIFNWQTSDTQMVSLTIEQSNDLKHWVPVVRNSIIAHLNYNNFQLINNEIKISQSTFKFFRITWNTKASSFILKKITGVYVQKTFQEKIKWIENLKLNSTKDRYIYDLILSGPFPIDRMNLMIQGTNRIYSGNLYSRSKVSLPWRKRSRFIQYVMKTPQGTINSKPIHINETRDRFWQFRFDHPKNIPPDSMPEIKLGWIPEKIRFLAEGSSPFTLAIGNPTITPIDSSTSSLISGLANSHKGCFPEASINNFFDLGGSQKLFDKKPLDWKLYLLWTVLLIGVGIMAFMARRLYTRMNK